ncbi:hypothetical protein AAMO2058_001430100 [Amorphochlora amoebiformis]
MSSLQPDFVSPSSPSDLRAHDKSESTDIDEENRFAASDFLSSDSVSRVGGEVRVLEGYLRKKSPKGIPGLKSWQQRYFVLTLDKLKYFPDPTCSKALGAVPIRMVILPPVYFEDIT